MQMDWMDRRADCNGLGPQPAEEHRDASSKRCAPAKYPDPGQCDAGNDEERNSVCELPNVAVSLPRKLRGTPGRGEG